MVRVPASGICRNAGYRAVDDMGIDDAAAATVVATRTRYYFLARLRLGPRRFIDRRHGHSRALPTEFIRSGGFAVLDSRIRSSLEIDTLYIIFSTAARQIRSMNYTNEGSVRAKSITLPDRQSRIAPPLNLHDFLRKDSSGLTAASSIQDFALTTPGKAV